MRLTTAELIRLFVIPILGTLLMFVAQPLLFSGQWLRLTDVKVQTWINNHYLPMAAIVLASSLLAMLIWIVWNLRSPHKDALEGSQRVGSWWFISIIPIIGTAIAIVLSRQNILAAKSSNDAVVPVILLFAIDIIFIYWLTTASSTPGNARRLPPGHKLFKR
jgi:cytochrome bd-type quinol oxidase subunit 2